MNFILKKLKFNKIFVFFIFVTKYLYTLINHYYQYLINFSLSIKCKKHIWSYCIIYNFN
jgi:hypothetical protein